MSSILYIPVGLLIVGGFVLGALAVFSWRRRSVDAGIELTVLLVAAAIWVLAAAAEHLSPSIEGKILASKIQYLGILSLPPASLVTVLISTGRIAWVKPCLRVSLPLAAICLVLVATNEMHHGVWSHLELHSTAALPMLAIEYGPVFWLVGAISHSQLLAAAILFFPGHFRSWDLEVTLVYIGLAAPWIANLVYLSGLSPIVDLDITPFGLIVTGAAFTASLHGAGSIFLTVKLAHRDVLDHIADPVLVFDEKERLLSANRAARRFLGTPILPAPAVHALGENSMLLAHLRRGVNEDRDDVVLRVDEWGPGRVFDVRSMPILSRRSTRYGTVVVLRDVTEQRAAQDEVRRHRQQLRQIVDLIPHPIYARDGEGRFIIANAACARPYGMSGEEMSGRLISNLHSDPDEVAQILENDLRVIESQEPLTTEEAFSNGSGIPRTIKTTKIPFCRDDSDDAAIVALSIDVSEEIESARLIHSLESTDELTNLSNRRHFRDALRRALDAAVETNRRAALLFLDLDRFKSVNDNYGHTTGDEVLKQVARRIQDKLRFGDEIVRSNPDVDEASVSRLGGDEFMIILPAIAEPSDAVSVARRLMDALKLPFEVGDDRLELDTSIGIAVYPEDGSDAEILIRRCDQALTNAKRAPGGSIQCYDASISAAEERRHGLEVGLRRAIERSEFTMHFQPIRDARSARLVGAEALIRWTSGDLGIVTPDEFIPVAEETGLVVPIGLIVVRSVCEQMAAWREQGYRLPRLSVNLSARQLVEADAFDRIERIVRETGVSGDSLEFELTEGSVLSQNPMVEETLGALQAMGATLALDDFGTGYSSLSHLRRFSFQRLKIDRSFVSGVGTEVGDEQLARAVIALAQRLDIETVAEGVETEEQLAFLREEGCNFVQGYLLGKPMPASEFEHLLEREKNEA